MKLDDVIKTACKEAPDTVTQGDKVKYTSPPRIPSDIFTFDMLTGGGIPIWKVTIFEGRESSGKTTTAMRLMGSFLKMFPDYKAVYMDFEQSFDKDWASNFIEDLDRTVVVQPEYGEQGVDIAKDMVKCDEVGFLLVDSLAAMIPTADAEKSAMEDTMGSLPKLVNKLIRKTLPSLSTSRKDGRPLVYLFINQLTSNVGARAFQSQTKKPGGMFQNFTAALDIQFYNMGYDVKKDIPVKVKHQFTLNKAKISGALPKRSGEFELYLVDYKDKPAGSIKETETVISYAKKVGIITQIKGGWQVLGEVCANLKEVEDALNNEDVFKEVKRQTLEKCYENYGREDND